MVCAALKRGCGGSHVKQSEPGLRKGPVVPRGTPPRGAPLEPLKMERLSTVEKVAKATSPLWLLDATEDSRPRSLSASFIIPKAVTPVPSCGMLVPTSGTPVPSSRTPIPTSGTPVPSCGTAVPTSGTPVPVPGPGTAEKNVLSDAIAPCTVRSTPPHALLDPDTSLGGVNPEGPLL